MVWLAEGEKIEYRMFIRFDSMYMTDRHTHTHRQTPHDSISALA